MDPSIDALGMAGIALADVVACAPRAASDWRMLASLVAFVFLIRAFAPETPRRPSQDREALGGPSSQL